jgi:membrane associated rhomboid family serine protease
MIPLRDVIPTRTPPLVTIALLVAQALLFAELPFGPALIHLAANVACLWNYGPTVEDRMGHLRFLMFSVLCSAAALVVQRIVGAVAPAVVVGFAGGIAGLIGAYLALYPESRLVTLVPLPFFTRVVELPAVVLGCLWLVLQFASRIGMTGVGGLIAGAVSVRLFRRPERMRVEWWNER